MFYLVASRRSGNFHPEHRYRIKAAVKQLELIVPFFFSSEPSRVLPPRPHRAFSSSSSLHMPPSAAAKPQLSLPALCVINCRRQKDLRNVIRVFQLLNSINVILITTSWLLKPQWPAEAENIEVVLPMWRVFVNFIQAWIGLAALGKSWGRRKGLGKEVRRLGRRGRGREDRMPDRMPQWNVRHAGWAV